MDRFSFFENLVGKWVLTHFLLLYLRGCFGKMLATQIGKEGRFLRSQGSVNHLTPNLFQFNKVAQGKSIAAAFRIFKKVVRDESYILVKG